tara:strand:- start:417355 stop:417906 length:552 start_codon:yes stop_codon:yes gene_type:complete
MFMPKKLVIVLFVFATMPSNAQEGAGLGTPISQQNLAPWDISIQPNGDGLPPGSGSVEAGEAVYMQKCIACHGVEGSGGPYDQLVGGQGTLEQLQQVRTVGSFWPYASTIFDYIRRAMPFENPQSLTNDEVYALTAYLLFENGIIDEDDVMNSETLPEVEMPNEEGFILAYPTDKSMEEMNEI